MTFLDANGQEAGRQKALLKGRCPGKPTRVSFKELGYSEQSVVRQIRRGGQVLVQVHCGGGSYIEIPLTAVSSAIRR